MVCPLPPNDCATMLHFCFFYRYLLVTKYLAIKVLATYNFSTCRHHLTENYLSFPSAPCWVRHSYLSKRATIDPLYFWVIIFSSRPPKKIKEIQRKTLKYFWSFFPEEGKTRTRKNYLHRKAPNKKNRNEKTFWVLF